MTKKTNPTALVLVSKNTHGERAGYIELCIDDAMKSGCTPITPDPYEFVTGDLNRNEWIRKVIPIIDKVVLYVDMGFSQEFLDVISLARKNDIPVEYARITPESLMKLANDLEAILHQVSVVTGYPEEVLKSKTRKREIADARCVYYMRSMHVTKKSSREIGEQVNRDHATVLIAIKNNREVKQVKDLYQKCFSSEKAKITAAALATQSRAQTRSIQREQDSHQRAGSILSYQSVEKGIKGVPQKESAMCGLQG